MNNRIMRVLFGLYMSEIVLLLIPKSRATMKMDSMKYASWVASQINRIISLQVEVRRKPNTL